MLLSDTLSTATRAISVNKSRSLLTMLGIIIGVGSVVLMTGIGKSMEGLILGQISVLGTDSMVIFPGVGPEGGGGASRTGFDSLTFDDVRALEKLTTIRDVAPVVFIRGLVSYGREQTEPDVLGTTPSYFVNLNIELDRGRMLDHTDEKAARKVALLGPDVARDLFFDEDPIGKSIKIGNTAFTVIGVLKSVGTAFFVNIDERIMVPLSAARQVTGQKYANIISLQHTGNGDLAAADVKSLLRQRHGIDNPEDDQDKDDFIVRSASQAQDILGSVSFGITAFITTIAGISLIVGGIGIMNIMLVNVTERTREIGLRKALGARRRDILFQFLIEAIALTCLGGLIGIVGGLLFAFLVALGVGSFLTDYAFALSLPAIGLAVGMAVSTGLLFGIYPARKAAEMDPISALRYE